MFSAERARLYVFLRKIKNKNNSYHQCGMFRAWFIYEPSALIQIVELDIIKNGNFIVQAIEIDL